MARRKERVPPHAIEAEESLLGAMLLSKDAIDVGREIVRAVDFYAPGNGFVFDAICELHERGTVVDPVTVGDELARIGAIESAGGRAKLISLLANVPTTTGAPSYATTVAEKATLRRLMGAAAEMVEECYDEAESDLVIERARDRLSDVELPVRAVEAGPHLFDFLDADTDEDWVIPHMLERQDRAVVTGGEGGGKSTLLRQIAVQATAGITPFSTSERPIEPIRAMLVDAENPTTLLRRKMRQLYELTPTSYDPTRLVVLSRPQGLNLLGRADRRWLAERILSNRPDVLIIGPHYKLHDGDPTEEEPARKLALFLDDMRIRHQFALLVEAHQPHAAATGKRPMRPYGASLWMRWPEMGFGIDEQELPSGAVQYHLRSWRGFRDDRSWPQLIIRGGRWPWTAGRTA